MSEQLQKILAELRERLTDLYGDRLDRLILYGSQARGDAEPDSDIDVLVVLKGPVTRGEESRRVSKIRADLSLRNNTVISCMFVSADRYATDDDPYFLNVRREGIRI